MPYKKQSTIVEFPENTPKEITLKTDPSTAKSKEYTSQAGKTYTKWTYFTADGGVFWAFSDFHKELQKYRAGDTLTVTYIVPVGAKYGSYKVEGNAGMHVPTTNDMELLVKESNNLIRMLIQRFDAQFPTSGNQNVSSLPKEAPREKQDTDLGF